MLSSVLLLLFKISFRWKWPVVDCTHLARAWLQFPLDCFSCRYWLFYLSNPALLQSVYPCAGLGPAVHHLLLQRPSPLGYLQQFLEHRSGSWMRNKFEDQDYVCNDLIKLKTYGMLVFSNISRNPYKGLFWVTVYLFYPWRPEFALSWVMGGRLQMMPQRF